MFDESVKRTVITEITDETVSGAYHLVFLYRLTN